MDLHEHSQQAQHRADRSGMRSRAARKDNLINSLSDGLRSSNLIEKVNIVFITEELLHVIVLAIESLHTKGGISQHHHHLVNDCKSQMAG